MLVLLTSEESEMADMLLLPLLPLLLLLRILLLALLRLMLLLFGIRSLRDNALDEARDEIDTRLPVLPLDAGVVLPPCIRERCSVSFLFSLLMLLNMDDEEIWEERKEVADTESREDLKGIWAVFPVDDGSGGAAVQSS